MSYLNKVKVSDEGELDLDSLTSLTSLDWKEWIKERLHGSMDLMINEGHDGDETSIFTSYVPELDYAVRVKAYEGIANNLNQAYEERKSGSSLTWDDRSLDMLLFLTVCIETQSEGIKSVHQDNYFAEKGEIITRFLDVIEAKPSFKSEVDLYARTLQALCGTQTKRPLEFWNTQLNISPCVYGSLCFSGACYNSPYDGITLLPKVDWSNKECEGRMHGSLLSFYIEYKDDAEVMAAIERIKPSLPKRVIKVFNFNKKIAEDIEKKLKKNN